MGREEIIGVRVVLLPRQPIQLECRNTCHEQLHEQKENESWKLPIMWLKK